MDAPLPKSTLLFVIAALLIAMPVWAAGALTVNGASTVTVPLNGSNTFGSITVGSTGDPLTFTVSTPVYDSGIPAWLNVSPSGNTTPATIEFWVTSPPSVTFGNGPFTAKVTVTDGVTTATANVTWTNGGSGPSGAVTATPNPLGLQLPFAGTVTGTLTVQSTQATATSFTVTASAGTGWTLSVDPASGSVSSSNPVSLTVTATASSSTATTYHGTIVIAPSGMTAVQVPVTLEVGGSGGGGGGCQTGTLMLVHGGQTCTTADLTFSYNTGAANPPAVDLAVTTTGSATLYNIQSIVTSDNTPWLLANATATAGGYSSLSSGLRISLDQTGINTLATGTYTGSVTLLPYPYDGGQATVNVTLAINGGGSGTGDVTVSPSDWTPSLAIGSGSQTKQFQLTVATGVTVGTLTAQANTSGWLSTTQPDSNGYFTVTINPGNLTAGTYPGNIVIPYGTSSELLLNIVLNLGTGGGSSGSQVVAPTSLSFAYQIGGATPPDQVIFVPGTAGQSYQTSADKSWLIFEPPSAGLPSRISVRVNPEGLAASPSPYTANLTIETSNGRAVLPVSLRVTGSPVLLGNPGTLIFSADNGYGPLSAEITSSAGGAVSVNASAGASTSWISGVTVTPNASTGGQTLRVTVNTAGVQTGTYGGYVQITADGMANSPMMFPVVLVYNGGGGGQGGALTLTPSSLVFNSTVNGAAPSQTLAVNATNTTSFTASAATVTPSGGNWLSISPSGSLSTPQNIAVSVNPSGLAMGTYSGTISLTSNGATQTVQVSLVIGNSSTGGNVTLDKSALNFTYAIGGSTPATQDVRVTNETSGSAQIPYTVTTSTAWLKVNSATGSTPGTVTVRVDPTSMAAGTNNGIVTITPSGGTAKTVSVLFTVVAPSISVSPTDISFVYRPGDDKPEAKTVQVTGGAGATFSASASSSGNWLSVTPTSGTANPANLKIAVNTDNLSAGTYNGTVKVDGTNVTTGSATINVTLNVMAPLPTLSAVGNAASYYAGSISAGEIITLAGTDLGPTAGVGPTVQNGFLATTVAGVQVFVSGYPAPITYASGKQINAVVPYEIASLRNANIWVKFQDQTSNTFSVPVTAATPGIFTADASGSGQGAILNEDYSYNGPDKPAAKGKFVVVYLTGEGQTAPAGVTGKVTGAQNIPAPLLPISVMIDGIPVTPAFIGEAPTYVSGVLQLNLQVPANARSGSVDLKVSFGSFSSNTVKVSVQ